MMRQFIIEPVKFKRDGTPIDRFTLCDAHAEMYGWSLSEGTPIEDECIACTWQDLGNKQTEDDNGI